MMTEDKAIEARLAQFIPPEGWVARWFLPSELRAEFAQRAALAQEDWDRQRRAYNNPAMFGTQLTPQGETPDKGPT